MSFSVALNVVNVWQDSFCQSQHTHMALTHDPLSFIHALAYDDLPKKVQDQTILNVLDLVGVGIGGTQTKLSQIICNHAESQFEGRHRMLFDGRRASATGAALALGMTIDALDGHDGFNPAKGHIGCGVFAGAVAIAQETGLADGREFLATIAMGYELGGRLALALHGTVPDYHTSGAWVTVAVAAIGARLLKLDPEQTRHALGIAEYHGPRSQMMRDIDFPTMVKDGSGWGAMAGVSAALLARDGFTGAPAITLEQAPEYWADIGQRWISLEQYYKPYPVCRWAQAPIEGVLELRRTHGLASKDVERIEVETFHESVRLATNEPKNTEEAQYSTSFPCAVAMAKGTVGPADIADDALTDPELMRLSKSLRMIEDESANAVFPAKRLARVRLVLRDGRTLQGEWMTPRWDAEAPPTPDELREKFHSITDPLIGESAAGNIEASLYGLPDLGLRPLLELLSQPMRR